MGRLFDPPKGGSSSSRLGIEYKYSLLSLRSVGCKKSRYLGVWQMVVIG
ncbi:MAG: hypothetical protein IIW50_06875 [Alistipes sp.]|nr:hypothetical protein [Alistipes sp.]